MEKNINNVNEQSTNLGKDICNTDDRKYLNTEIVLTKLQEKLRT